jgi:hypothetical protein
VAPCGDEARRLTAATRAASSRWNLASITCSSTLGEQEENERSTDQHGDNSRKVRPLVTL